MKIIEGRPPNFDKIAAAFPIEGKRKLVFAWGDTIYNPDGGEIHPVILIHEAVHGDRQAGDPESWWNRYLIDARFRLDEELPAHAAEFRTVLMSVPDRNQQARMLHNIAQRLSSEIYGGLIKYPDALVAVRLGVQFGFSRRVEKAAVGQTVETSGERARSV